MHSPSGASRDGSAVASLQSVPQSRGGSALPHAWFSTTTLHRLQYYLECRIKYAYRLTRLNQTLCDSSHRVLPRRTI